MRLVVWPVLVASCSAQAPPSGAVPTHVAPVPVAVEVPPPEPALPAEPAGLVSVAKWATSVCELKGPADPGMKLAGFAGGDPLWGIASGDLTLSLGEGAAAFAEVRLPNATVLRGYASREVYRDGREKLDKVAIVYPKRWLAFGGVVYPGSKWAMTFEGVRNGKVVVGPLGTDSAPFELEESARTMDLGCSDLALRPEAAGELQKQAPPAFLPSDKETFLWLSREKAVPVSATADGPPAGSFVAVPGRPTQVALLERKGRRARVRQGRVAGWVDAARLSAQEPKHVPVPPPVMSEMPGLLGILSGRAPQATEDEAPAVEEKPAPERRVSCNTEVRLVVEKGKARFVVGSIPAGLAFVMTESESDLVYLSTEESAVHMSEGARLAVPMRDAAGCADVMGEAAALGENKPEWTTVRDAIGELPGPPPRAGGSGFGTSGGLKKIPKVRMGAVTVSGRLPPEVIQRIVRQDFGLFRFCYDHGLARNPALAGRVSARFVIKADGTVAAVSNGGSDLGDQALITCVLAAFKDMVFPKPEGGIVSVVYPILLSPE